MATGTQLCVVVSRVTTDCSFPSTDQLFSMTKDLMHPLEDNANENRIMDGKCD